jgi:alpha-D-xyloside xylohydrolase
MAGNPYWCSDIGGFQPNEGSLTDEILIRWFQAGTFFPIFRVHGSRNTEIYNMSTTAQPIATAFSKLRYRLMPYIYSLAWKVTSENYTMTRALPFDFPDDATAKNIADEFMLGPALLINPVSTAGATSRNVYLPAGNWYDFWTGTVNTGTAGRAVTAPAPLQIIPIYARAGAILPMGPRIQYATQSADPIELRVYPGADGSFNLYEDEGDGYGYESNKYAIIPISYSNTTGRVTIGARTGSFPGMLASRTFNVVAVTTGKGIGDTVTANPDCVISYNGSEVSGCPVSVICPECVPHSRMLSGPRIMKSALEHVSFPGNYAGAAKEVAVYDISGRLLHVSVCTKQTVSLRKDFGLPDGMYIIRVTIAQ